MTLTLAIPTFNARSEHLDEALSSIARQSRLAEVDVVVVDNGSDPENASFLVSRAQVFPDFRFVRHDTNLGYDRNLMRLLADITTDFVWFFGDDDILFDDALSEMLDVLRAHPEVSAVLCPAIFFHETSELSAVTRHGTGGFTILNDDGFIHRSAYTAAALSTLCVSVARMRSVDVEFALGTNWVHFGAFLQIFSCEHTSVGVLMKNNLLAVRRSNAERWFANFGNQYQSGLSLITMIDNGRSSGLKTTFYDFYRMKRYSANLIDILTLAWPLSLAQRDALARESSRHFGEMTRFKVLDRPILRSPNWVKRLTSRSISLAGAARRAVTSR